MSERKKTKARAIKKNIAETYNAYKNFEGHQYTGMTIGRSHKWYYDKGVWRDKKITPDKWEISFEVTKRRAGHAPEGSGVPVGTEYHWYIMAHQIVKKLNADDYSTSMTGIKFKVAHKRADKNKWNATPKTQRKRLIKFLKEMLDQLKRSPEPGEIPAGEAILPAVKKEARKPKPVPVKRKVARGKMPARRASSKKSNKITR